MDRRHDVGSPGASDTLSPLLTTTVLLHTLSILSVLVHSSYSATAAAAAAVSIVLVSFGRGQGQPKIHGLYHLVGKGGGGWNIFHDRED